MGAADAGTGEFTGTVGAEPAVPVGSAVSTSSSGIGMHGGSRVLRERSAGFHKEAVGGTQTHEGLVEPGRQVARK